MKDLTFAEFTAMNIRRCEYGFNHKINDWDLSDWFLATLGELGEAANVAKKLNRIRDGIEGNTQAENEWKLRSMLADELADTFIYLNLLIHSCGFDFQTIVLSKYYATSRKIGYSEPK